MQIPSARTDDVLEALGGGQWFSCLDLASGYRQVQVKTEDGPKTAFSTHRGQFQWRVMPFGLTSGPARFTRLMNAALSELTSTHCLAYLDGIIIWAPSLEEHLHRLRLLFDRIRTAALKLKPTLVVSSDGIKTDPDKVETVRTWPIPVDIKELQSFIGLAITIGGLFLDSRSSQNRSRNCRGRVYLSSGRWNKKVPSMN